MEFVEKCILTINHKDLPINEIVELFLDNYNMMCRDSPSKKKGTRMPDD